ncbi:MAG: hypothetical protein ABSF48_27445 [Thermodesulfobacteriota bacterium]|jgi:hypothetical protein
MDPIDEDKLLNICNKLDPILKAIACIKETMEQAGPSVLVDDYFNFSVAFERINEAKEKLGKIAEKQEENRRRNHGYRNRDGQGGGGEIFHNLDINGVNAWIKR